jgi:hypothetical protein
MQFVGTFHNFVLDGEESLMEEVSEAICLNYDLKIVQIIFYVKFFIQNFLLMIWFFILVVKRNHNIFIFIWRWEPNSDEMFLNKQEAHNTKKIVVELASRDAQEEV